MADRRDEKWEERGDKLYSDLTYKPKRTVAKWFFWTLGVVLAISLLFGAIRWIGSWGSEAARVTGVENTREQYQALIGGYENLKAAAINSCNAGDGEVSDAGPTLLEDPTVAYAATYNRIAADYNRRFANWFEAGGLLVDLPSEYPREAPTLEEMQAQVC